MRMFAKIVSAIVLTPIVLLVVGIGGCEARKAYYDWQVRRMCEKDGGVTVYERVTVTREEYERLGGSHGQIPFPEERAAPAGYPYVTNTTLTVLKEGYPEVRRSEALVKRRADGKVLARFVTYSRVGGDFPSWAHHSSKGCDVPLGNVSQNVLTVEGAAK